ncbi:MAG: hypothetical protein RMK29_03655 [Myxococcales bacterium]|nr:hypothetical protein [Myxococcota bacterium]MDW8280782.1 hypothetical protein [Myxococcales bacterium]
MTPCCRLLFAVCVGVLLGTCSDYAIETPADEDEHPALPGLQAMRVLPAEVDLEVGEAPVEVRFTAVGEFDDGRSEDITDRVLWSFSARRLGYLKDGATLVTTGYGGQGRIEARSGTLVRGAVVRLRVRRQVVLPGAEGATEARFRGPAAEATPRLVYPYDQALLPPNLAQLEVHFQRPATQGLFELALRGAHVDVRLYTRCQPLGDGCGIVLERRIWDVVAHSSLAGEGGGLEVGLRGLDEARGAVGTGASLRLFLAPEAVRGGVYYWTSLPGTAGGSGIYRIDMERGRVEPFYTDNIAPPNHRMERGCIGCHALSRAGDRMALVLGGGHISDLIQLEVATGRITLRRIDTTPGKTGLERQFANFQSYSPDGRRLVVALHGRLRLMSADSGQDLIAQLPAGGQATHPDWSRSGALLAFTRFLDPPPRPLDEAGDSYELYVRQTGVGLMRWNGTAFQPAQVLLPPTPGRGAYYPSVSPDDRYLVFNRVECPERPEDCVAYDNARARVHLMPVDGGGELRLERLNRRGPTDTRDELTNSWPRFSPFVQRTPDGRTLLWVTFSSKRNYGLRIVGKGRPQLWMAALALPPAPGGDASFAPFWIPGQDPSTHNHLAQWTEQVVPVVQ